VPLQGVLFYVPHWFWKNWEGGKIKRISEGLRGSTAKGLEERRDKHDRLVRYIKCALHTHGGYAFGYFFCEILNFVNVVSRILRTVSVSTVEFHQFLFYGKARISNVGKAGHLISKIYICYKLKIETTGIHSSLFILQGYVIQVRAAAIGHTCRCLLLG